MKKDNKLSILVIEDDLYIRKNLCLRLEPFGKVLSAKSLDEALRILDEEKIDVGIIDLNLGTESLEGLQILKKCVNLDIYSIILTSQDQVETKIKAYDIGCKKYFLKSKFLANVTSSIENLFNCLRFTELENFLNKEFLTQDDQLISQIKSLQENGIDRNLNICLTGPKGVGKSALAKLIHRMAEGEDRPFVRINAAKFSPNLIESELFGYEKSPESPNQKRGLFEIADGGTLFLNEFDSLPKDLQVKIQVALKERKFTRVGSIKPISINFRLISATCSDIFGLIQEKKVLKDFYYKIRGLEINIPPLHQRKKDIPILLDHFLQKTQRELVLTRDAVETLIHYSWPENVREIKNLINVWEKRGIGVIRSQDLPDYIVKNHYQETKQKEFLSKKQLERLMEEGLSTIMAEIEDQFFEEAFKKFSGKSTKCRKFMGIGTPRFVKIYNRFKGRNGINNEIF